MKSDVVQQPESNLEPDAMAEDTTASVDNLIVWLLALSPIVGIFFEMLGIVLIGVPWLIVPDVIALALSIYLGYMDRKKLRAMGHDTSKLGPPWLVPIYLFKRARRFKHKLTYFIIWCALCVGLVLL
ncbi:MAG: hypothetical protein ACWGNK_02260 [Desulfobacterales bacterium]